MPDNSYFDRRMANGDKLSDIFDGLDSSYGVYTEDKKRPITVRVGDKYNYVADNYILFDNWFAYCRDFLENDNCTYAYRRSGRGLREGGVLIRRDGSFVTREEFCDIKYNDGFIEGADTALVKQYNGLFNFINVKDGTKAEKIGLDVDYIDYYGSKMDFYLVAKGDKLNYDEEELLWGSSEGKDIAREKNMKFNIYQVRKGIISPSQWFDYIDYFMFVRKDYCGPRRLCNHTIVCLNDKVNLINQEGKLLSEVWFDECHLHADGTGDAGILKSERFKNLPTTVGDNYDYNPEKFNLYTIDYYGRIKAI